MVGSSKPRLLGVLGPGLITGVSSDGPSGIATYASLVFALGIVAVMRLASNRAVMGRFTLPLILKAVGWAATAIMALSAVNLLATAFV